MTPEEKRQFEQLKATVKEQQAFIKSLTRFDTIPRDVGFALERRLAGLREQVKTSTKGVDTEDVTVVTSVNFGGQTTNTAVVLDDPDEFLEVTLASGLKRYIPAYTS